MARAEELGTGQSLEFLQQVDAINLRRRDRMVQLTVEALGGAVEGRRVAALGLAFKPDSDDVRDSPALDVAANLHRMGALVTAYDPEANHTAARVHPELSYVDSLDEAIAGAEVVVVLTEWKEFRDLTAGHARELTADTVILDGRNCLDRDAWRAAGWTYASLGRP